MGPETWTHHLSAFQAVTGPVLGLCLVLSYILPCALCHLVFIFVVVVVFVLSLSNLVVCSCLVFSDPLCLCLALDLALSCFLPQISVCLG